MLSRCGCRAGLLRSAGRGARSGGRMRGLRSRWSRRNRSRGRRRGRMHSRRRRMGRRGRTRGWRRMRRRSRACGWRRGRMSGCRWGRRRGSCGRALRRFPRRSLFGCFLWGLFRSPLWRLLLLLLCFRAGFLFLFSLSQNQWRVLGMRCKACQLHRRDGGRGKQHETKSCHVMSVPRNELKARRSTNTG